MTSLTLFGLGLLGILVHVLHSIPKLEKKLGKKVSIFKFIKIEARPITISLIMVIIAVISRSVIPGLEMVGEKLGLGIAAIGYSANSLLAGYDKKIAKFTDSND